MNCVCPPQRLRHRSSLVNQLCEELVGAQKMAALTKAELREALQLKGVPVPPGSFKKDVLVRLYREHVPGSDARLAAGLDFSSDEELDAQDEEHVGEVSAEVRSLTNDDLFDKLREFGYPVGPIVDSTRGVYEKRLQQFLNGSQTPARPSVRRSTARPSAAAEFSATDEDDDDEGTPLQDVPVSRLGLSGNSSRGEGSGALYSPSTSSGGGGGHFGYGHGGVFGGEDVPVVSRTSATFTTAGSSTPARSALRARAGALSRNDTSGRGSQLYGSGGGTSSAAVQQQGSASSGSKGLSLGVKVATVAALVAAILLVYASLEYFKVPVHVPSVVDK